MDAAEKFSNRISQEKNLRTKTLTGASVLLLGLTAFSWFSAYSLNSNAKSEKNSVPAEGTPNASHEQLVRMANEVAKSEIAQANSYDKNANLFLYGSLALAAVAGLSALADRKKLAD